MAHTFNWRGADELQKSAEEKGQSGGGFHDRDELRFRARDRLDRRIVGVLPLLYLGAPDGHL